VIKKPKRPPLTGPRGGGPLKPKETRKSVRRDRFVKNITSGQYKTAKEAAAAAGYASARVRASELLRNNEVRTRIRAFFADQLEADKTYWRGAMDGKTPTRVVKTGRSKREEFDMLAVRDLMLKHGLGEKHELTGPNDTPLDLSRLSEKDLGNLERILEATATPES
jgi:hypothetical protein